MRFHSSASASCRTMSGDRVTGAGFDSAVVRCSAGEHALNAIKPTTNADRIFRIPVPCRAAGFGRAGFGVPQCGQETASVLTSFLHSLHLTSATQFPYPWPPARCVAEASKVSSSRSE